MKKPITAFALTVWSIVINLWLGLVKVIAGATFHSQALIADGIHSLSDLATDLVVIFGLKIAPLSPDGKHPYGHHRFASIAQLFIAVMIFVFAVTIIWSSVQTLQKDVHTVPGWPVLVAAIASIVIKEWLFWWTKITARRLKSSLLMANAIHHRTDSFSSMVVAIAVAASYFGGSKWAYLDDLAGVLLGGYLGFEGIRMIIRVCDDLVDAAPDKEIIDDIREHIMPTKGVVAYHDFRTRKVGDMFEVDMHLQVDPTISIESGHNIAKEVKETILAAHPEVVQVLIHIEPASEEHLKESGVYETPDNI